MCADIVRLHHAIEITRVCIIAVLCFTTQTPASHALTGRYRHPHNRPECIIPIRHTSVVQESPSSQFPSSVACAHPSGPAHESTVQSVVVTNHVKVSPQPEESSSQTSVVHNKPSPQDSSCPMDWQPTTGSQNQVCNQSSSQSTAPIGIRSTHHNC